MKQRFPKEEADVLKYCAISKHFWRYIPTILRFTKEKAKIQKQAFPFVPARYFRTFDVISEVIVSY